MKSIKERPALLLVPCGNGAVDIETIEHSFDVIVLVVNAFVPADRCFALRTRRNEGADAVFDQWVLIGVAVVSLVSDQLFGSLFDQRALRIERLGFVRFPAGRLEGERDTYCFTERLSFTSEPSPRAAKAYSRVPPLCVRGSDLAPNGRRAEAVVGVVGRRLRHGRGHRLPNLNHAQQAKALAYDFHLPYLSGRSRHSAPVRIGHGMSFATFRFSCAGRHVRQRSDGSSSPKRHLPHSLRSPQFKTASLRN